MQARTMAISVIAVLAASPGLWMSAHATGQTIIPIDQGRSVSTDSVNAPQCGADFLSDLEAAVAFEPFDGFVQTQHGCDSGFAGATAGQQSRIDATSMSATSTATSEAYGPVLGVVHAFGVSLFVVTFEVARQSRFAIDGTMSAGSFPDGIAEALGLVRVWEGPIGGVLIFVRSVAPEIGGELNTQVLEGIGVLEPGVYTLDVQAGAFIDNEVPPGRTAEASFDFTFDVSILGDLDGDGAVGILDFLQLLGEWGPCPVPPAACAGDLDGDGVVGILDFLLLLGNWGTCP